MVHARTWFQLMLVAMMGYCVLGEYVTCDGFRCVMKTEKSYYEVDNYGARMYLLDPQGNPHKELTSFGLGFSHLIEREKNVTNPQLNRSICFTNNQEPTLNYKISTGDYFGEIRQIFVMSELVTYVTVKNNYPAEGIHTAIYTSYIGPTPILEVVYSISTINLNITLSNDTTNTAGWVAQEQYSENSLKIGLNIVDFPWSSPSTGQNYTDSFLTLYLNTTYQFTEGDVIEAVDNNKLTMTVTNDIQGYGLRYVLDYFYLIDNVPYMAHVNFTEETKVIPGILLPRQSFSNLNLCPNNDHGEIGHFRDVSYDPSIGVLFSSFPSEEQSDQTKKRHANTMIAVYVIVPIVVVALAVTILVILFVPAVYNTVLTSDPFKRNGSKVKTFDVSSKSESKSASAPILVPEPTDNTASASTSSSPASSTSTGTPTSWTNVQKPPRE